MEGTRREEALMGSPREESGHGVAGARSRRGQQQEGRSQGKAWGGGRKGLQGHG